MAHKRSVEAQARREQRREARKFLFDSGRMDRTRAEFYCLVSKEQIADHLESVFGHSETEFTEHEKGEIISDSKGKGSCQG
ncbi:hypothetical protein MUO83_07820 [Candidatus Bathyarchaeota archaeon]|nr:hypothetical protein [Candidatus Bathyarchaeota archaeon]